MEIKILINKVLKSKDGKTIFHNFTYLIILQVIGYVFPLITMPYLASVLGVEGYGKIAFAASIVIYFKTVVDWGFQYTSVRDIAKKKDDTRYVSSIFYLVFFSKLILFLLCTIIFGLLITYIPILSDYKLLLWLSYLLIPGYILFPDWFFQAMEQMKYITIMNFFSKLIFTLLVFLFIKKKTDYYWEPLLVAMGMFVSGITATIYAIKKFKLKFTLPSIREIFSYISRSTNMFISTFIPNIYSNFTMLLLGFLSGETAAGIYSSGRKFSDICDQFANVLSRTFYPFLSRRIEKHNFYVKLNGTLSILMSIFLFVFSDLLVSIFYTAEFSEASSVMKIMSLSPIFMFMINTYGPNYLVLIGKDNIVRNIDIVCSILGFVLSYFLVVNFSYIGAAVTIVLVRMMIGILNYYYARKYQSNKQTL